MYYGGERGSVTLLYAGGQLLGQLHLDAHYVQLAPPPRPALDNFTIKISLTLWTTKSLVTLSKPCACLPGRGIT